VQREELLVLMKVLWGGPGWLWQKGSATWHEGPPRTETGCLPRDPQHNLFLSALFKTGRELGRQAQFSSKLAAAVRRWEQPFFWLCYKFNSAAASWKNGAVRADVLPGGI